MSDQPPPYPSSGSDGDAGMSGDAKGFLGALFDFSFSSFITPKIVKVVYAVATVLIGLYILFVVVFGFSQNAGLGVLFLIVAPIVGLIFLAFFRMALEMYVAIVRMSEDVHRYVNARR